MMRLSPFASGVIFIMMNAVAIDTAYFSFGIFFSDAIFFRTSFDGRIHVGIAENLQNLRIVF